MDKLILPKTIKEQIRLNQDINDLLEMIQLVQDNWEGNMLAETINALSDEAAYFYEEHMILEEEQE